MKKIGIIIIMGVFLLMMVGCEEKVQKEVPEEPMEEDIEGTSTVHEHCTRIGHLDGGEVSLNYDIYYTGKRLNTVESEEIVTSESSSLLDTYEKAYQDIHNYYQSLDYYETRIERSSNSVTSRIFIQYDKVDINQLLRIEGEEDNIIVNGVARVDKWKELAKKLGASCEIIED